MTNPKRQQGSQDTVLSLRHVAKFYGDVTAVSDVSLDVRDGEILTLLGPSGCGKTTTLRMIIGLEECDGGNIVYDGRVMDGGGSGPRVPIHKRNMGMVFQSYAVWPHMSVAENIAYPLRVRRARKSDILDAVQSAMKLVGLEAMADRPGTKLSGGQQQRVALARALVFNPGLLLLDEPFSNLDARLRDEMRAEVKALQRRLGIAVVFVTHDQFEALSMSDRVAVMNAGRIEQIATPEELYRSPKTRMVRDFIGEMLTFQGRIEGRAGGKVRVSLSRHESDEATDDSVVIECTESESDLPIGAHCELSARPEDVKIAQRGESLGSSSNVIQARLDALLFLGDRYEARVSSAFGQDVRLFVPIGTQLREGTAVDLVVAPHDLRLWGPPGRTFHDTEEIKDQPGKPPASPVAPLVEKQHPLT